MNLLFTARFPAVLNGSSFSSFDQPPGDRLMNRNLLTLCIFAPLGLATFSTPASAQSITNRPDTNAWVTDGNSAAGELYRHDDRRNTRIFAPYQNMSLTRESITGINCRLKCCSLHIGTKSGSPIVELLLLRVRWPSSSAVWPGPFPRFAQMQAEGCSTG
jgi:hypothetical protein